MKNSNIIIALFLINAVGCGLKKSHQEPKELDPIPTTGLIEVSNQLDKQDQQKLQLSSYGTLFYTLGAFDARQLPLALRNISTESEVGTLTVIRENETYKTHYAKNAEPMYEQQNEETEIKVFLIKDEKTPKIYLGIKKGDEYNPLLTKEMGVQVLSNAREYCSIFYTRQFAIANGVYFKQRQYPCNPDGTCAMTVFFDKPFPHETPQRIATYEPMFAGGNGFCNETQTHYDGNKTMLNKSKVKAVIINLDKVARAGELKIKFDL